MKQKSRLLLLISLFLVCTLLAGCTEKVSFENGHFPIDSETLTLVLAPGETQYLSRFSNLKSADFSGSTELEEIALWAEKHPEVEVIYTVTLPDGQVAANSETALDLSSYDKDQLSQAMELIKYLPELQSVKLSADPDPEILSALTSAYPDLSCEFEFTLNGKTYSTKSTALDLNGVRSEDLASLTAFLPAMKQLASIDLGQESADAPLSWDTIYAIHEACPQAELKYSFSAFGKDISLSDEELILRHIPMDDEGQLAFKIASCMRNLKTLDMDSCGVSNEKMAEIRDALPDTNVVWRVVFGRYSVRTDVEHIMASNPGMGGDLRKDNTDGLKYCTKVKYLDLGHNRTLDSIDFVSYMPDLEVAILAMNDWCDASPLADCPKLEYLELFETGLDDLRPLAGLKNLRHLNIAQCYALHDLSPIYGLENLERLWIGAHTPIPLEQIEKMRECAPNCDIDATTESPLGGIWRFTSANTVSDRYKLLYSQMGYGKGNQSYAYYYNDPLYFGPGQIPIPPLDNKD